MLSILPSAIVHTFPPERGLGNKSLLVASWVWSIRPGILIDRRGPTEGDEGAWSTSEVSFEKYFSLGQKRQALPGRNMPNNDTPSSFVLHHARSFGTLSRSHPKAMPLLNLSFSIAIWGTRRRIVLDLSQRLPYMTYCACSSRDYFSLEEMMYEFKSRLTWRCYRITCIRSFLGSVCRY